MGDRTCSAPRVVLESTLSSPPRIANTAVPILPAGPLNGPVTVSIEAVDIHGQRDCLQWLPIRNQCAQLAGLPDRVLAGNLSDDRKFDPNVQPGIPVLRPQAPVMYADRSMRNGQP